MLEKLSRKLLSTLLKAAFRVEVRGIEHFHATAGGRTVIIANHQSFLDPLLLAVFMPEKPAFAMNVFQAQKWYFKPLVSLVDVYKVDPSQPISTKGIIQRLKGGGRVVIFPEGRITVTGGIMKIYEGTGMIVERTGADVLPVRIEGAQFTKLSRMGGKQRTRWFPKITLTFLPPRRLELPEDVRGRKRRSLASALIYDMMTEGAFAASPWRASLPQALAEAARMQGFNRRIVTDVTRAELTYRSVFARMFVLSRLLARHPAVKASASPYVGVLLPTSIAGTNVFLALQILGKIPAMLNFSAGERVLEQACAMVEANVIVTSRAFVEKGNLQSLMEKLATGGESARSILYLEDLREGVTLADKLSGAWMARAPQRHVPKLAPDSPAVVLYTSGSEGAPKGVALSHANILANVYQVSARFDFTAKDTMLNALPIFHSFGLTVGTLLPLLLGIRTILYPTPLHYRIIPELAYDQCATILLGTDTFFSGYAKYAHPFDFFNVRLAVAGAEKLKPATQALYTEKFRVQILEGYGVTEASPVIACNTTIEHKEGSVGRLFPLMEYQLEEVEGLAEGARLLVKGPNIMLGYIRADKPGVIQKLGESWEEGKSPPSFYSGATSASLTPRRDSSRRSVSEGGWYDTGDIVTVDARRFITIKGRAKRFAKIGGEMISLAVIEEAALALWPGFAHAAMAVADPRKGEQIVLVSESPEATREAFLVHAKANGMPEIALPRKVNIVEALPRLGSGKVDYMKLKEMLGTAV